MNKPKTQNTTKKGFFALLKESMIKTSEGCGPGCGCHSEKKKENVKDPGQPNKSGKKVIV